MRHETGQLRYARRLLQTVAGAIEKYETKLDIIKDNDIYFDTRSAAAEVLKARESIDRVLERLGQSVKRRSA